MVDQQPPPPPDAGQTQFAPPPPPYAQNAPTNGMAVAALIFGILGLVILYGIGPILALIFGYVARGQIKRSQGQQGGQGMALAGIILGWIGLVLTILFFALIAVGVFATIGNPEVRSIISDEFEKGFAKEQLKIDATEAGCGPVEKFPSQGEKHVAEGAGHPAYNSDPPTSGPHYELPAQPGFYTTPLAPEALVHNLEHGQIVIWYNPDADGLVLTQIEILAQQEQVATVAAPYEGVSGVTTLVITAWQHSQACESPSQEVMDDFRRQFQGHSPEPITPEFTG